ncbi:MAG: NADPH:quinone oxidoreductase family protein [Alphaproteobacteria bacterium]
MRALVVHQWTKFENLKIEEWPSPKVIPGHVKIRTQAVGMNFALSLRVEGKYQIKPQLPFVPGVELCGYVIEVGEGVTRFKPGDRVTSFVTFGAFGEEAIAPEHRTFKLPDSLPFYKAVGYTTSFMTTYAALVWPQWFNLQFGETIVVHGAAGGVGLVAIEIAKILGATVVATCGSDKKVEVCRDHGADYVVNYRNADFRAKVLEVTNNIGANAVYDPVGGDVFMQSLRCLAPEGRIMPIGFAGGTVPQIPANFLLVKNVKVLGFNLGYYNGQWGRDDRHQDMGKRFETQIRHGMDQLFRWTEEGRIRPEISHVFPFSQYKEAMAAVLGRDAIGRVAVAFDEEAKRLNV